MKKEYWYKELESHIRVVNASSGQHKTILITGPILYQVVTRVNFHVIKLWAERTNQVIKETGTKKVDPIARIGWLQFQRQYRRNIDAELRELASN